MVLRMRLGSDDVRGVTRVQTNLSYFSMDIVEYFVHLFLIPLWLLEILITASLALLTIQLEPQGVLNETESLL